MRSRIAFALAAAAVGAAIAAATTSGGVTTTYHGIFSAKVSYSEACTGVPAGGVVADGVWNVAIHGDQATVTINIFTDGKHHVSYGTKAEVLEQGPNFSVGYATGAGYLTLSRTGDEIAYTIAPYHYGGVACDTGGVVYHGELR
jgi:hypothetical protein